MKNWRLIFFQIVVYSGFFFLAARLYHLQVMDGPHYRQMAEKNRLRLIRLDAARGNIYDRNGSALATNRSSFDVYLIPEDFDRKDIPLVARVLNMPQSEIEEKVRHLKDASFVPLLLKTDVSRETVFELEENKPELSGVVSKIRAMRYYPFGKVASHILGYLGRISADEYKNQEEDRYDRDAWLGRGGIEKSFEGTLRGMDGGKQVEVNSLGRHLKIISEKHPVAGHNVNLTIDARLQEEISRVLGGRKGAAVLLDIERGEVLAMVSKPEFDPNVFVMPEEGETRLNLFKDKEDVPLLNRGIGAEFPPGSVFKLVTALAALETGKITPETRFFCPGRFRVSAYSRPFKCWKETGHGSVNLYQAIERSCNVYFYHLGARIGVSNLARYSHELGFGDLVQLELTNIAEGLVPDEKWKQEHFKQEWYQGETLNFAIGQGYLLVTPLQVARLIGLLATEGVMPQVTVIQDEKPQERINMHQVHAKNIRTIKEAMLRVVQSDFGTAKLARVEFMEVAGKTGTAQVPHGKEAHSWFSGFFPYDHPKYALVIIIEHGGSGGLNAAKLAKEIMIGMKDMGFLPGVRHAAA